MVTVTNGKPVFETQPDWPDEAQVEYRKNQAAISEKVIEIKIPNNESFSPKDTMESFFLDDPKHIYDYENVALINSFFGYKDWDNLFPKRQDGYDYKIFLEAVAAFPDFCEQTRGE